VQGVLLTVVHRWVDTVPSPWRNGGGVTREIARSMSLDAEASGAGFDWRFSVAEVAEGGPFSSFPGVDRILVLLSGAGIDLDLEGERVELRPPFGAHAFPGETAVVASLVDGPTTDLNVMCRRGAWKAAVELIEEAGALGIPTGAVALVHVVEGEITLESGEVLGVGDTAECHGPAPLRWLGGTVVAAALQPC
jgi:environmental stress-induced protein Ves